jgi:hypothetical protein
MRRSARRPRCWARCRHRRSTRARTQPRGGRSASPSASGFCSRWVSSQPFGSGRPGRSRTNAHQAGRSTRWPSRLGRLSRVRGICVSGESAHARARRSDPRPSAGRARGFSVACLGLRWGREGVAIAFARGARYRRDALDRGLRVMVPSRRLSAHAQTASLSQLSAGGSTRCCPRCPF